MKRIRKFIAAALAGLLALMLLAGCEEAPVPQAPTDANAELVAMMNDCRRSPTLSGVILQYGKEFKADSQLNAKAQDAAVYITEVSKELDQDPKQIEKAFPTLVDGTYIYRVSYARNISYKTDYFNRNKAYEIVQELLKDGGANSCYLNQDREDGYYDPIKDSVVSVGFAQTKDGSYIVAVMRFPAELPK